MRRGCSWAAAATVGFGVWGLLLGLRPLSDNSFLTHLATGRLIVDSGFPGGDPFSFTAAGEPWVIQSWLASVVYATVEELAGGHGLLILNGLLTSALAALSFRLTRPADGLVVRLGLGSLAVLVGTVAWRERPLLMALVLLALLVLVAEERRPWWLAAAVLLMWVHVHGSWPLGLVYLALVLVGRRLDGDATRDDVHRLGAAIGGVAIGAVGPEGVHLLWFPFELLGRRESLAHIAEWRAPGWTSAWQQIFLAEALLALVALRSKSRRHMIILVVFGAAAALAVRNIGVAAVVILPTTAAGLRGVGRLSSAERSRTAQIALVALVAVGVFGLAVAGERRPYDLSGYPVRAVAWAPEGRMAHQVRTGNLLEVLRGPEASVFVDDRISVYDSKLIDDVVALERGRDRSLAVLADREIDIVVWARDEPLSALLAADRRWRMEWSDGEWVVASRRDAG